MIVSAYGFSGVVGPCVTLGPSRVAAQGGGPALAFWGAGKILFRNDMVRDLMTAAGIWVVAAIGLVVDAGLYLAASAATLVILIVIVALKPVEEWLQDRNRNRRFTVVVARRAEFRCVQDGVRRSSPAHRAVRRGTRRQAGYRRNTDRRGALAAQRCGRSGRCVARSVECALGGGARRAGYPAMAICGEDRAAAPA